MESSISAGRNHLDRDAAETNPQIDPVCRRQIVGSEPFTHQVPPNVSIARKIRRDGSQFAPSVDPVLAVFRKHQQNIAAATGGVDVSGYVADQYVADAMVDRQPRIVWNADLVVNRHTTLVPRRNVRQEISAEKQTAR